jgi:uncharacterized protein
VNITLSGASGFIGTRLRAELTGHNIRTVGHKTGGWDPAALRETDAVIHLAGEPVGQRWTAAAKERIRDSRVQGTRRLVEAMASIPQPPRILVCASAIGYYGARGDEVLTETSAPGHGFLSEVCVAWEREAQAAESLGTRVVRMRTGLVLDRNGGALARMLPPFRMGLGGPLGSGRQWMSWIHIQDLVALFVYALEHPLSGPVNGVAPEPVTNVEFTRALASALHRPAILPMPTAALQLMFGEMSEMLLASLRVLPSAAEAGGFTFRYPNIRQALSALL